MKLTHGGRLGRVAAIDPRIVKVGLTIGSTTSWYSGFYIRATGKKLTSTIGGECKITILGLNADTRNTILRNCNRQFVTDKQTISVKLMVGRESYGASLYYQGDVFRATPAPKPDIGVVLRCIVGHLNKTNYVTRSGSSKYTSLKQIATWTAADNGYSLQFQIDDKNILSYSFSGSADEELKDLRNLVGDADVYVDNGTMFVKNSTDAANGTTIYNVSVADGNLLSAEATESGVDVQLLFNPNLTIGSKIKLTSTINSSLNGTYTIIALDFDVSKRDQSFNMKVSGISIS